MKLIAACARIMGATGLFGIENKAKKRIDTLVLGCTHYPLAAQYIAQYIERQISQQAGAGVQLIDTGDAVARQTRLRLLAQLAAQDRTSTVQLACTGNPSALQAAAKAWLAISSDVKTLSIA